MSKVRRLLTTSTPISACSTSKTSRSTLNNRFLAATNDIHRCGLTNNNILEHEYEHRNSFWVIGKRRLNGNPTTRGFSSNSESKSNHDLATAEQETPKTMESLWKESTARLLDPMETPVGSMTSVQWHLAETLALYWSSSNGRQPKQTAQNQRRTRGSTENADNIVQKNWFDVTKQANDLALQIIDRLAEEKNSATSTDDDDFRTIDVSLVHAILKQWKDGLHWGNNNNKNNPNRQSKDDESIDPPLPSKLLQKLDSWTNGNSLFDLDSSPVWSNDQWQE